MANGLTCFTYILTLFIFDISSYTNVELTPYGPLLGIGMGNPGVEKGYPYPNPEIPVPGMLGRGISGLG